MSDAESIASEDMDLDLDDEESIAERGESICDACGSFITADDDGPYEHLVILMPPGQKVVDDPYEHSDAGLCQRAHTWHVCHSCHELDFAPLACTRTRRHPHESRPITPIRPAFWFVMRGAGSLRHSFRTWRELDAWVNDNPQQALGKCRFGIYLCTDWSEGDRKHWKKSGSLLGSAKKYNKRDDIETDGRDVDLLWCDSWKDIQRVWRTGDNDIWDGDGARVLWRVGDEVLVRRNARLRARFEMIQAKLENM